MSMTQEELISEISRITETMYKNMSALGIPFTIGFVVGEEILMSGYGSIEDHSYLAAAHMSKIKEMRMHANQCDGKCGTCSREDKGEPNHLIH